jgi:hypothetical protein
MTSDVWNMSKTCETIYDIDRKALLLSNVTESRNFLETFSESQMLGLKTRLHVFNALASVTRSRKDRRQTRPSHSSFSFCCVNNA